MKYLLITCVAGALLLNSETFTRAAGLPFDGSTFRGRIAYSADGNNRDRDDLFEVRYYDGKRGRSEFRLFVGGVHQGQSWTASPDTERWQSRTIANVPVNAGDEIRVQVRADGEETGRLDYVQLNRSANGK